MEITYTVIGFTVFWVTVSVALFIAGSVLQYFWSNYALPILKNIKFALFGSRKMKSYYAAWRRIYERPGLHAHWKSRRMMRRFAYRRLVLEARREAHKKRNSKEKELPGTTIQDSISMLFCLQRYEKIRYFQQK